MTYLRRYDFIVGLLALLLMMLATPLSGQAHKQAPRQAQGKFTINGFVHDAQSGETLIAANVMELNSRTGAVTNEFGHYSLTLPAGEVLLQFSYVGYQSDTIRPQLRLHYHA